MTPPCEPTPDQWNGLRDWRVWALTLTLQWPSLRVLARYAPWPGIVIPICVTGVACLYAASLKKRRLLADPRFGSTRVAVVAITVLAAANLVLYPRIDSRKDQGRGSDEDDAVIVTAERLVTGQRPVYVPTYLGNPPFPGPGWALMVSPLAVTGTYALLTPIACAALVWLVGREGACASGRALALLLPLSSPGFWEMMITGSDLFAIGVLFAVLVAVAWQSRFLGWSGRGLLALLGVAAASSRVVLAYFSGWLSVILVRGGRGRDWTLAGVTALLILAEWFYWWPDRSNNFWSLLLKGLAILGPAPFAVSTALTVAACALNLPRHEEGLGAWWRSAWVVLVVPLAMISVAELHLGGWRLTEWHAVSYLEVAVPALVAFVALERRPRRNDSS